MLSTSHPKIVEFYKKYTHLDFEQMNLSLLQMIESAMPLEETISKSIANQILAEVTENKHQMQELNRSFDIQRQMKQEFICEMKSLLHGYVTDHIRVLVEKENVHLSTQISQSQLEHLQRNSEDQFCKLSLLFQEQVTLRIQSHIEHLTDRLLSRMKDSILPENFRILQENVRGFIDQTLEETRKMVEPMNLHLNRNKEDHLTHFIENFEKKYNLLMQTISSPILAAVHGSEEKVSSRLDAFRESTIRQEATQGKVFHELGEFLDRYRNSSYKGQLEENHLHSVLTTMFPMASIQDTSKRSSSGDFIVLREKSSPILIENKDYKRNVNGEEIQKFILDCTTQNCHGIFLSQNTGITSKANYQIDFNRGKLLIYVHCVQYQSPKIQTAFDIIDSLSRKWEELTLEPTEAGISLESEHYESIPKDLLDDINTEYQRVLLHRDTMLNTMKDFYKKMTLQIEEVKLPNLDHYLGNKYASLQKKTVASKYTCDYCNEFGCTSQKALASHRRSCKKIK